MLRITFACLFLLTVQIYKSDAFTDLAERSTGCAANLLDIDHSYFPMVLHKHLDKRAGDSFGDINLKRDMMFFYCPNETNYLAGPNGIEKIAPILCWKGTLFNFDDARCNEPIRGTFEIYQESCGPNFGNGAVLYRIGFRLPLGDFITVLEACWDKNQLYTLFTRHEIQGSLIQRKLHSTSQIAQDVQVIGNSLSSIFIEDDFDELFSLYMQSVLFLDNMVPPMVNYKSVPLNANSIGNNGNGNINVGGNSYGTYTNQNDNSAHNAHATYPYGYRFNNNNNNKERFDWNINWNPFGSENKVVNSGSGNLNMAGSGSGDYLNSNDNRRPFATRDSSDHQMAPLFGNGIGNTGHGNMNVGGNSHGIYNNENDNSAVNIATNNSFRNRFINSNDIGNTGHGNMNIGGNAHGEYSNQNDNSASNYQANSLVYRSNNSDENTRWIFGTDSQVYNTGDGNANLAGSMSGSYQNNNDNRRNSASSTSDFSENDHQTVPLFGNGIGNTGHGNMNVGGNSHGTYNNENDNSALNFATNSFRTRFNNNGISNTGHGNVNVGGNSHGTYNNENDNSALDFSTNPFRNRYINNNDIGNTGHGNINIGGNAHGEYSNQNDNSASNYQANPFGYRSNKNSDDKARWIFGSDNQVQNSGDGNANIAGYVSGSYVNTNDNRQRLANRASSERDHWFNLQLKFQSIFRMGGDDLPALPVAFHQLSPKYDFAFTYERTATLRYINSAPMLSSIATEHLLNLEQEIRRSAAKNKDTLQMINGVHDVLDLPNMGEKMYLGPNFKVPVPKYIWKMVIRQRDNTGIVFVLYNSEQKNSNNLCPGVCGNAGVFNLPAAFVERSFLPGYIQCCSVQDFLQVAKEAPRVGTQGVLQLF